MRFAQDVAGSIAFYAAALAVVLAPAVVEAQPVPTFSIDHYVVYRNNALSTVFAPVTLRDQFGQSTHVIGNNDAFAVPTDKNGEGVFDPRLHYMWWRITSPSPDPVREVVIENQFGAFPITVRDAAFLLTPTFKNPQPAEQPPDATNDHYKCYLTEGDNVNITVLLGNQYGLTTDIAVRPDLLCNPVEKELSDGTIFPINKPNEHLVCYVLANQTPISAQPIAIDQFGLWGLALDLTVVPVRPIAEGPGRADERRKLGRAEVHLSIVERDRRSSLRRNSHRTRRGPCEINTFRNER